MGKKPKITKKTGGGTHSGTPMGMGVGEDDPMGDDPMGMGEDEDVYANYADAHPQDEVHPPAFGPETLWRACLKCKVKNKIPPRLFPRFLKSRELLKPLEHQLPNCMIQRSNSSALRDSVSCMVLPVYTDLIVCRSHKYHNLT